MFSINAPIGFCGRAQYPKNMFTTYYIVLLSVNQKTSKHVKDEYTKSSVARNDKNSNGILFPIYNMLKINQCSKKLMVYGKF